jgi:hypothetical protein
MDNNNWPDPARPGVPMNPEVSGCHWVTHPADEQSDNGKMAVYWNGVGYWFLPGVAWKLEPVEMEKYKYHGPALTPAEVDARVKEARRDALREAALWDEGQAHYMRQMALEGEGDE